VGPILEQKEQKKGNSRIRGSGMPIGPSNHRWSLKISKTGDHEGLPLGGGGKGLQKKKLESFTREKSKGKFGEDQIVEAIKREGDVYRSQSKRKRVRYKKERKTCEGRWDRPQVEEGRGGGRTAAWHPPRPPSKVRQKNGRSPSWAVK